MINVQLANVLLLPSIENVSREKGKVIILNMLTKSSAKAQAKALLDVDVKYIKNIIRLYRPTARFRSQSRPFMLAQLVVALIKISEHKKKFDGSQKHPRRRVVALLKEFVNMGEKLDWAKTAKIGFTITPIGPSTKVPTDYFLGDTLKTVGRRLKEYGITPKNYGKIFNTKYILTDKAYSEKQRGDIKIKLSSEKALELRNQKFRKLKEYLRKLQMVPQSKKSPRQIITIKVLIDSIAILDSIKEISYDKRVDQLIKVEEMLMDIVLPKVDRKIIEDTLEKIKKLKLNYSPITASLARLSLLGVARVHLT